MKNLTFQAHFNGKQILPDYPVELVVNTKLLVTVLEPTQASDSLSSQQLLASLNAVYADGPTDDEREQLRQMAASQRRLVEGEW